MKSRILVTLPLAAMLAFPAFAQTSSTTQAQSNPPAASSQSSENATGKQPLQSPAREGFWGRVNPFARKNYVRGQKQKVAYGVFRIENGHVHVIDAEAEDRPFEALFRVDGRGDIHGLGPQTQFPFHLSAVLLSSATPPCNCR